MAARAIRCTRSDPERTSSGKPRLTFAAAALHELSAVSQGRSTVCTVAAQVPTSSRRRRRRLGERPESAWQRIRRDRDRKLEHDLNLQVVQRAGLRRPRNFATEISTGRSQNASVTADAEARPGRAYRFGKSCMPVWQFQGGLPRAEGRARSESVLRVPVPPSESCSV